MRVAKADKEDIEVTMKFLQACELFWDNRRTYSLNDKETEWLDLDEDDDDKKELLKIRKGLARYEGCTEDEVDNRLIIFEFLKRRYQHADAMWRRVVFAADILIDNVCDESLSYLEYHPSFEQIHVANEQ